MATLSIALGAGGARGIAHIHVLRALDDLGVQPEAMAGTSIGAIMAAGYCAGMDAKDIEAFIEERLNNRLRLMREIFKIIPPSMDSFLADGGLRIGELNLERILNVFLPDRVPDRFGELAIPLSVVSTDYHAEKSAVFARGPLRPALAASASMPAVFLPVRIGRDFYTDGSATNPVPMDVLQGTADHVLGIDVSGGSLGERGEKPGKFDVAYAANGLMQRTMAQLMAERLNNTALLRAPGVRFRALEFLKARQILAETHTLYDDTKRAIDRLLGERMSRGSRPSDVTNAPSAHP